MDGLMSSGPQSPVIQLHAETLRERVNRREQHLTEQLDKVKELKRMLDQNKNVESIFDLLQQIGW